MENDNRVLADFFRIHRSHVTWAGVAAIVILVAATGAFSAFGMTGPAQIAFAILIVAAILWITEAIPLFVTSLLILFLSLVWLQPGLERAGTTVSSSVFTAPFFSNVILLFLGGFVISTALNKFQLDEQLARRILQRTGSSLPRLLLAVMAITAFLSMWLSNTAASAMMLALILPMANSIPEGQPARKGLVLGIPFAANIGGLGTPIGSPPNAIAMQYLAGVDQAPSFVRWMTIGVPMVLVLIVVAWFLLRKLFQVKGDLETKDLTSRKFVPKPGVTVVIIGTLITVIGWMTTEWHGLSSGTIALIPVLLFFGLRLLNVRDFRSLSWDVLFVMGGGLCLGAAMSQSGLADWVVQQLPIDGVGTYSLAIIVGIAAVSMSSVMSNTATANLLLPIVVGMGIADSAPVMIAVAFCCSLAMPLPISTPPNALAFSSGELRVADLIKPGLALTVLGVFLVFALGWRWWDVVGIF
tara:strand:+ start:13247 stop:14653 length:1407 start_codon:yes stop_codon:yes gene_type:complete